jgi:hypothetical protein
MKPAKVTARLALYILAFATSGIAVAQFPGGGAGGGMGRGPGGPGGGPGAMGSPPGRPPSAPAEASMAKAAAADLQMNIARLRDDLKLTKGQEFMFDTYVDKITALGDDILRSQATLRSTKIVELEGPQQFGQMIDLARNRLTAIEDIAEAGMKLFESLSVEQKSIANRRLASLVTPLLAGGPISGMIDPGLRGMRATPP